MIYEYDGTFAGFLSALFEGWYNGISAVEDIVAAGTGTSLFSGTRAVGTDYVRARRIVDAMVAQCGAKAAHYFYYAFLSDIEGRERSLIAYARWAFHYKEYFMDHLSDEPIWTVRQWARKTGNERHSLLGLLRFRELSGHMLYARLAPTCNVVPVMAPHFARRLPGEEWVIHDTRRHFGVYYDRQQAVIVEIPQIAPMLELSDEERGFEQLWKQYYETIAIEARHNEKCRRQFMPKKYWKNLIEM